MFANVLSEIQACRKFVVAKLLKGVNNMGYCTTRSGYIKMHFYSISWKNISIRRKHNISVIFSAIIVRVV